MKKVPEFTKEEQVKLNQMFDAWMENDLIKKTRNFRLLNQRVRPGSILFVGDSITEGYPLYEMFPFGYALYNRGISGETSKQLLENLQDQIIDLKPSKIFMLIGTNDIERENHGHDVGKNILDICQRIMEVIPEAKIHVLSIYPVNESANYKDMIGIRTNEKICEINQSIKQYIKNLNITYIDLYDVLAMNGHLIDEYTHDGLHLSIAGYQIVTQELSKYL